MQDVTHADISVWSILLLQPFTADWFICDCSHIQRWQVIAGLHMYYTCTYNTFIHESAVGMTQIRKNTFFLYWMFARVICDKSTDVSIINMQPVSLWLEM